MAKQFTLGKTERLKSRKIIERLFSEGKNFSLPPFRVYYLEGIASASPLQFGVGVSSKNFKKAVERNRIKRMTREAWRTQNLPLQAREKYLQVFLIYTARKIPEFAEVREKLEKIINKLTQIANPLP